MSSFHCFAQLPAELRQQIWIYAMPLKLEPAFFHYKTDCWQIRQLTADDLVFDHPDMTNILQVYHHELLDPVQFSHPLLSVNSEARWVARDWIRRQQNVDCYLSQDNHSVYFGCQFNPSRDLLYISPSELSKFLNEPDDWESAFEMEDKTIGFQPAQVRYLAVPLITLNNTNIHLLVELVEEYFPGLKELQIVVGRLPTNEFVPGVKINRRWYPDLSSNETAHRKAYQAELDDGNAAARKLKTTLRDVREYSGASLRYLKMLESLSPSNTIIRSVLATRSYSRADLHGDHLRVRQR